MAKTGVLLGLVLLLSLAAPALAAPAASAAPVSPSAQAEVEAVLRQAGAALERKDLGLLTGLLDDKAVVEVRGLGLDRRTVGRQRVRALYGPELARAQEPSVVFREPRVRAEGPRASLETGLVAYVVPELPEGMESLGLFQQQRLPVPGRLSAVLEKQGRRWVFLKMLLVFPGGSR